MRTARARRRGRPGLTLLGLVLALQAACTSQPTMDAPRRLDAPLTSGARLFDEFLSPRRLGEDVGAIASRSRSLLRDEMDLRTPVTTAGELLAAEGERLGTLPVTTRLLTRAEVSRLSRLRHSPALAAVDPAVRLGMLRQGLRELPTTLHFDRRMMDEADDFRHRTDPADDHPEAGFVPRVLRRILP